MAPSVLAGKTVIVTGGGSGIGLALTKYFVHQNSKVIILDVSQTSGTSVLSSLRQDYPKSHIQFKQCDISDWEVQKNAFKDVWEECGSIDVVIANAGISEKGNFLDTDADVKDEPQKPNLATLDVNLVGTLYTIKLAVHYMRKKTSTYKGSIVCTSSNAGLYAFPVAPVYAVSKHAVVGAVRSLARPLQPEGIQINGLAPAVIKTNIAPDSALFDNMIITPVETVINAVEEFVTKPDLTGIVAEIHGEKFTFREQPEYVDEDTEKNIEMFWKLGYA